VIKLDIDVASLLQAMESQLRPILSSDPLFVGIHTGGVWLAQRLCQQLDVAAPIGTIDISFYRDDFSRVGIHPQVKASHLPEPIDDRHIILIDDVLHTGRTIRAALNEIFAYGRPRQVSLAVLVERGGRELPIQPDVVATRMELDPSEHVKLLGPEPLTLQRMERR
jgi:pyrimidine operon attenuation protein/uracil phosphoribosyltransferase